jgi:peptidoglycan/LPS O-acetylase OafA/YrhL
MFVVFAFFDAFVAAGKPMSAVRGLFVVVIVVAVALGSVVGRFYSEPMNRYLRERWREDSKQMGSAVEQVASAG